MIQHKAACRHFLALTDVTRQALPGQSRRIQRSRLIQQDPVQTHFFAYRHAQNLARLHFFRLGLQRLSVPNHPHPVRMHRQQIPDIAAGTFHRLVLQLLPNGVKQHDRHRFRILSYAESPYGSDNHQTEFIEEILLRESLGCILENRPSNRQIGQDIPYHRNPRHLLEG